MRVNRVGQLDTSGDNVMHFGDHTGLQLHGCWFEPECNSSNKVQDYHGATFLNVVSSTPCDHEHEEGASPETVAVMSITAGKVDALTGDKRVTASMLRY